VTDARPEPIPVTVIGGYLGSGKTTLLNQLLRQAGGCRIALLINDFGAIGIDGDLIADADGDTITLTNGCVCCSIGSDLMSGLWSVRDRVEPPDRVIIEASGIADPAPIAHHALTPGFDLDGVVVLLDADTVRRRERDPVIGRTIRRQLAAADVLVLSKVDLVSPADMPALDEWVARRAPGVPVLHARDGQLPIAMLMGLGHAESSGPAAEDHAHDYVIAHVSLDEPVDRQRLEQLLDGLPPGVLRVKGIVRLTESPDQRAVVHRVAGRRAITDGGSWRAAETGRLVFIALAGTPGLDDIAERLIGGHG
jgi:G3E family GTPase